MEDLTKQQLVLVALLVSFVTSIATGIVTVSLVQQAPAGVSETINRVVQETIQGVSPSTSGTPNPSQTASVVDSQKVVTEDDLITAAVAKNSKSIVRISGSVPPSEPAFLGLGFIVTKTGVVIAPESILTTGGIYYAALPDGSSQLLQFLAYNDETKTAYFKITPPAPSTQTFTAVTLGDSNNLAIGQGVVELGGESEDAISPGVITSLITDQSGLALIQTDTTLGETGAPLLDLNGNVIGFSTTDADAGQYNAVFLPSNILANQITAALQTAITTTTASSTAATSTAATSSSATN